MFKLQIVKYSEGGYTYEISAGNNRLLVAAAYIYPNELSARFAATRFAKGMSPLGFSIHTRIKVLDCSNL